jgi:WD40 repeat protein/transcriptional regulator with XRE-family HTH domain
MSKERVRPLQRSQRDRLQAQQESNRQPPHDDLLLCAALGDPKEFCNHISQSSERLSDTYFRHTLMRLDLALPSLARVYYSSKGGESKMAKHQKTDQHERENAFGRSCARLRKHMHLTQRELGRLLGISEQALQQWERGVHSPTVEHLKRLLALALQRHAFAPGQEHEEAQQLWLAAGQPLADFEVFWMQVQLASASAPPALVVLKRGAAHSEAPRAEHPPLPTSSRFDWGDALAVDAFYGREAERVQLSQWVLQERCQVVSVLGMGGIGKSALSVTFMHQVASSFQAVVFRSVRDAPPCQDLLADCLHVLSPEPLPTLPASVDRRIDLLLDCLQRQPCLLVLDNLETLLQALDPEGHFRPGYQDYAALLRRVAQTPHQSCLLLTSRETPAELGHLESPRASVRALRLRGLEPEACAQLLEEREVMGSTHDRLRLAQRYAGNPLALNIVAEAISELFGGQISSFLEQDTVIFSSIRDLLAEQWTRLSALEQALLLWLAVVREPRGVAQLHALLVTPVAEVQVSEALEALQRRSLVEQGKRGTAGEVQATFTLQSVVLEYVTEVLVERVSEQVQHAVWEHLISYALEQAGAKEYVRQAQERLLVAPVLLRLQAIYRQTDAVEEQLLRLLNQLRTWDQEAQGYGPANLIMLLRGLRGHLRRIDLSRLAIRGAYLQGVEMQDARLSGAILRDTIFTEAFDATWSVAMSSNGRYWAAGSKRGEVRVWREGGQILHLVWQAHTDTTASLAFSPDERLLASGSWDGNLKLWDVERGTLLWDRHTDSINSVAFVPDGSMLASGGDDALIQLWNVTSETLVQTLTGQGGAVHALAWSPDGKLLASSGFDGRIRVWEIENRICMQTLEAHSNWVTGLAFAPNGTRLASASWDRTVRLWDLASGRLLQTLMGHRDRVLRVAWSPDGRTVASAGFDNTIWLWDVERESYQAALHGHSADVYAITFTPDSGSLLSGSEDGTIRVWDVKSGQCVRIIGGYAVSLYDVDWSPDGTQLVSGGTNTLVTIWEAASGMPSKVLRGHSRIVHGVVWSPDGRLLASAGWDNSIRLWDATTGACLQMLRDPDAADTIFQGLAWSPDGSLLASGSYLRGVQVWDATARTRRWVGHAHSTKIRRVAWSPDGTRLASGGDDGSVCLWEASDGTLLKKLQGHSGMVASVTWSPDGTQLASGGTGQGSGGSAELFVWDAQSAERVQALSGHAGIVFAVAWSKRGDLLVSGGSDGILRWWDVQRGECVTMREGHHTGVQSLRVSPDGHLLASCGDDNAIKVWDLQSAELLRTLRPERPYERLTITGIRGLTEAQKATLRALGAVEENETGVLD